MSEPDKIIPAGWKRDFKNGEVFLLKNHEFMVVAVTRRGLAFRKVTNKNKSNEPEIT